MSGAFASLKLVAEPGGAVALAAILSGAFPLKGRTVAIVLSGGNIDPQLFSEIICEGQETALSRP
jgi:threonine dehydratase